MHVTKLLPGEVVMFHLCSTAAVKLMLVDNSGSPPTDGISPVSSAGSSAEISGNSHVPFVGTNSALQMMGIVWTFNADLYNLVAIAVASLDGGVDYEDTKR